MSLRLTDLVEAARDTTRRHRAQTDEASLRAEAEALGARNPAGRFREALDVPGVSLIAEVKGASPIAGPLRESFDPVELAGAYREGGAAAVSVLTEEHFFRGSIDHLLAVSSSVELPTLRKDFVVDLYQIFRAATAGASAVLLIAELLDGSSLKEYVDAARSVGLDALVEFHRPNLLVPAVEAGSGVVGINNRNLDTMEIDVEHALRLAPELPRGIVTVAESAISSAGDVRRVAAAGFGAILVGTALVTADDPRSAAAALVEAGAVEATEGDESTGDEAGRGTGSGGGAESTVAADASQGNGFDDIDFDGAILL
jgi:indole-3-glycerol phosphate synthase